MKKILIASMSVCLIIWGVVFLQTPQLLKAQSSYNSNPTFQVASSTAFTLTNTSQRLLGTSTATAPFTRRLAATIQPIICTSANQIVYLNFQQDKAATTQTGFAVYASTTAIFADYFTPPFTVQSAVQGIVGVGASCTVLVTEWRSQY